MAPQASDSKSTYQTNEKVLCFHGEFLYEAKIQELKRTDPKDPKSPHEYKIHYKGWKNTWDDWVSFDRLRKWTDENRELAAQLRREHTQAQKALTKPSTKSRRGQGSEIGSGRGSEERTSSVPAAGRGSKRARDNDIEKEVPLVKNKPFVKEPSRVPDHSPAPNNLPGEWDFLRGSPGQSPAVLQPQPQHRFKPSGTPTIPGITSHVDLEKNAEQPDNKDDNMAPDVANPDDPTDLRHFIHAPRKAAVKATVAIEKSTHLQPLTQSNQPVARKRKAVELKSTSKTNATAAPLKKAATPARKTSTLPKKTTTSRARARRTTRRSAGKYWSDSSASPAAKKPRSKKNVASKARSRNSTESSASEYWADSSPDSPVIKEGPATRSRTVPPFRGNPRAPPARSNRAAQGLRTTPQSTSRKLEISDSELSSLISSSEEEATSTSESEEDDEGDTEDACSEVDDEDVIPSIENNAGPTSIFDSLARTAAKRKRVVDSSDTDFDERRVRKNPSAQTTRAMANSSSPNTVGPSAVPMKRKSKVISDTESEKSKGKNTKPVKKARRARPAAKRNTKSPGMFRMLPARETRLESEALSVSDMLGTSAGRIAKPALAASRMLPISPVKFYSISPTKTANLRPTRSTTVAAQPGKATERPWRIRDTRAYTSADVDHILARSAPPDQPEFISHTSLEVEHTYRQEVEDNQYKIHHAPLLSGTTRDEENIIDQEIDRDGTRYQLKYLGNAPTLPEQYERLPEDIEIDCYKGIWRAAPGVARDSVEIDPPGSGTSLDALKYPGRLVDKVNQSANAFPEDWDEAAIAAIPDYLFERIGLELLAKLSYKLLKDRPWDLLKQFTDSAPFWRAWERDEGRKVIDSFATKVRTEREMESASALLMLAAEPVVFAPRVAPKDIPYHGMIAPMDFPVEVCGNCAKYGEPCDGMKPVCSRCYREGLDCRAIQPLTKSDKSIHVKDSYLRSGSVDKEQTDVPGPRANDVLSILRNSRGPIPRQTTGLDPMALPGNMDNTGRTGRTQGNFPKSTQGFGRATGPGMPYRPQAQDLALEIVAQSLMVHDIDVEVQEIHTYMVMYPQEDAFYARPSIRINVPDHLKSLLVDDWENVTKSLLLVPLPSQAPANYIIDEYFNEEKVNRHLGSAEADILEEFCAGLKMYFEKAVGKILLYRFERSQLAEVRKLWESGKHKEWEGKGPGDCYGAEHLTRMIVNLPEMIAQTNMDVEAVSRLKAELSKFSTWLSRNSTKYFCAKYEKPSAEYIENAR